MLERLLIACAIVGLAALAYYLWTQRQLRRRARPQLLGLERRRPDTPLILYFTTASCGLCRTLQRPALRSLRELFGAQLQVITIDANRQPKVADYWGVLSVPTTFVFDRTGTPRAYNMGVANTEKLLKQLADVGLVPPADRPALSRPVTEKR